MISHPPSTSRKARGLDLGVIALLILLLLNLFSWPVAIVDETLDGSWQAILTYAFSHGLRFGHDIIFTYGPLGALSSYSYSGYNPVAKYGFELLLRASIVLFAFRFLLHLKPYSRLAFLSFYLLTLQLLPNSSDTYFFLGLLSWVAAVLYEPRAPRPPWVLLASGVVFVIFIATVKFTLLVAGTYCLFLVALFLLIRKRFAEAVAVAAAFPPGLIILWSLLGQRLGDLPSFLYRSYLVAHGYAASMQLATDPRAAPYLVLFLLGGVAALCIVAGDRTNPAWVFMLVAYVGLFFMAWKQGVVRSDDHIWQFFCYVPLAGWFLYPLLRKQIPILLFRAFLVFQGFLMIASFATYYPHLLLATPQRLWDNTRHGIDGLLRPRPLFNDLAGKLHARKRALFEEQPLLARIGNRTVDLVGNEQGLVIDADLNYRPRPTFQNYVASDARLEKINATYWRTSDNPAAVLQLLDPIDGGLPTAADSQTILYLLSHYQVEAEAWKMVLLTKRLVPSAVQHGQSTQHRIRFDQSIVLKDTGGRALVAQMSLPLNFLGRLRAFLYKPPIVHMELHLRDGSSRTYRVNPPTLERDFLFSPVAETASQLWQIRRGAPLPGVVRCSITTEPGTAIYFSKEAYLRVTPVTWD